MGAIFWWWKMKLTWRKVCCLICAQRDTPRSWRWMAKPRLEAIATDPVDAIILDVMLPGRDGFSVAAELRAQQNFVPILMLTARGRPEDVLNGFSAGADDYLPKPFDLAILLARLKGLLRRMAWLQPGGAAGAGPATAQC